MCATLIAVYDSDGCRGRCDAKCYDASEPDCECICGGKNHGAGRARAEQNTRKLALEWIDKWRADHPGEADSFELLGARNDPDEIQLPLQY